MKVATFTIAGERRVGVVDPDARTVTPFSLSAEQVSRGIVALIERNGAGTPRTLSPIPLDAVTLEAPIPLPARNIFCVGKNYFEHAHEFALSGFDSSASGGAVPKHPIIFSKVPESVVPIAHVPDDPGPDPDQEREPQPDSTSASPGWKRLFFF